MSTVIKIECLGKSYTISHEGRDRYTALRDVITNKVKRTGKSIFSVFKNSTNNQLKSSSKEEFWALKDINFEVNQGDRIGIIGRNGAGKSTLLKILSRITEPTTGIVKIKGKVASLLEVGTGFHPELTGNENIYLNGAILGMSRTEVKNKFDEIVDFSGVEKFLDTPVKRYSSGMYVRLAFAVAAHLDSEILIIDEVLAVGDGEFQKKCLGTMEALSNREGRTVLFVSHNMGALANICNNSIVLEFGKIAFLGNVNEGINYYISSSSNQVSKIDYEYLPDIELRFKSISICDAEGQLQRHFSLVSPIVIEIEYEIDKPLKRVQIICHLWNIRNTHIFSTGDIDLEPDLLNWRQPGVYTSKICIPGNLLAPDIYKLSIACGIPNLNLIDEREGPIFEVTAIGSYAETWSGARQNVVLSLPLTWETERS